MTMTPDQLRRAIQQARPRCGTPIDASVRALCDLLEAVLPDLVALASGRSYADADAGRRHRDAIPLADNCVRCQEYEAAIRGRAQVGRD